MIVCDTNVLVSAFAFQGGLPDRIFRAVLSGRLEHAISPDIVTEFTRVLADKIGLPPGRVEAVRDLVVESSRMVYPRDRVRVITLDDAVNRILECAQMAGADFIVTGDRRHLLPLRRYGRAAIVSPHDFAVAIRLV